MYQERQAGGALLEKRRAFAHPLRPGSLLSTQASPLPSKAHSTSHTGPGGIGRRPRGEQEKQMGGALRDRRSRRGEEGIFPAHLSPGSLLGSQVEVPCPLRPGVGVTPGPLLFLEPKPHLAQPPGPFPALGVLSIGPTHLPNLALA